MNEEEIKVQNDGEAAPECEAEETLDESKECAAEDGAKAEDKKSGKNKEEKKFS